MAHLRLVVEVELVELKRRELLPERHIRRAVPRLELKDLPLVLRRHDPSREIMASKI